MDAAARAGAITGDSIDNGMLRIEKTEAAAVPDVRITDILLEVDNATRFTEVLHAPANRVALCRWQELLKQAPDSSPRRAPRLQHSQTA